MASCSQCGKPAKFESAAGPLCVDHYDTFQNIYLKAANANIQELNLTAQAMNMLVGMDIAPMAEPIKIPEKKVKMNYINISHSVVGSVNTGEIKKLEVTIGQIEQNGNKDLAALVKTFTETALEEKKLDAKTQNELLEHINTLFEAAKAKKEERKPGLIALILSRVAAIVAVSEGLTKLWGQLKTVFESIS